MEKKALWAYFIHNELDLNKTWNVCAPYAYHTNEIPRKVWLWKEITLCAHCMNKVSCLVWNGMLSSYVYEKESFCA